MVVQGSVANTVQFANGLRAKPSINGVSHCHVSVLVLLIQTELMQIELTSE